MFFVAQSLLMRYEIHKANRNISSIRRNKPREHSDRCRFSGAVGAEKPEKDHNQER
jgi:hypothetical protein